MNNQNQSPAASDGNGNQQKTKFCKFCGAKIPEDAVICIACGRQVEELRQAQNVNPTVIVNNNNVNNNVNNNNNNNNVNNNSGGYRREKNKWVAVLLCLFLGAIGVHKFYEGKIGMGILYIFTVGIFGIGIIIDLIVLLLKPNPYYI